ncbi:hypothetical protein PCANB_002438 [Pneumocystis canis]|nr:hypothetical protein PCANB_002438 [Pneumocystis canis]
MNYRRYLGKLCICFDDGSLNDSLLFSFEKGYNIFILVEGTLLHYGLHHNNICKPKRVIIIQYNTNIRVLNHVDKSRWILEVSDSIQTNIKW